jgi:hypothetical protein
MHYQEVQLVLMQQNSFGIRKNANKMQFLRVFYPILFNTAYLLRVTHTRSLKVTQVFQVRVCIVYTASYILIFFLSTAC